MKDARSASLSGPFGCRMVLRINRPFDTPVGVRVQRVQKVVEKVLKIDQP